MPRYYGGAFWPYAFAHQPGGWAEQTFGMGYGNRNWRHNDIFSPQCSGADHHSSNISLDSLSGLVARLILQNHLTRLGDAGCQGGAVWGCSHPSPSTAAHCRGAAPPHSCQAPCVHTCPGATQPYMGTNNVFVIPANLVNQQPQVGGPPSAGVGGPNNVNMFLSGLGPGLGGINTGSI
ncbi:hypothetical protein KVR01_007294 [Diaporthe batatas]|uniref:uncharacterized protein n=1 Tax=Diaporthe batatas TaxID=748121 RepID=UPI001D03AA99|nr:uncharacterized protein KVR01_007294 [Diaporthe batatas]KAG8162816.1 hypothetical protein KVR01_007294 [Diaporthe batatas]